MLYRRLGRTGLELSALSLGSWLTFAQLGRSEVRQMLALAYEQGINLFDSAESHGHGESERLLGDVLADLRFPRDAYCVASKVGQGASAQPRPTQRGLSRKHVLEACEQACRRLRVDYLDLYLCDGYDPATPVAETVAAMDLLVRQGKVLYWGTSEWPAQAVEQALTLAAAHGLAAPVLEQPRYHLLRREPLEMTYAGLVERHGLGLWAAGPLASGLLTGKYDDAVPADARLARPQLASLRADVLGPDQRRLAAVRRLAPLASELGVSRTQLAIAWCLRLPQVGSVLLGARGAEQLAHDLGALALLPRLDQAWLVRIDEALATID